MTDLAELLSKLELDTHKPKFKTTTLQDLVGLDSDELKEYLKEIDIPVIDRSKIRKEIGALRDTQGTSNGPTTTTTTTATTTTTSSSTSGSSSSRFPRFGSGRSKSKSEVKSGRSGSKSHGPLPAGWKEITDEKSGKQYYWNTATREVTWHRPTEAAILEPDAARPEPVKKFDSSKLGVDSFELKTTLGTGSFGRVRLVQSNENKQYLALKILKKSEIIRMKQVHHIRNEKTILERINHPFIVNLLGYFQDKRHLYLALEYVPGGELFSLLRRRKRFNNDVSVFYAAQIVLAFEHLHSMHIAYRDLKPENILIHRDGYIKITDFGFAKEVADDSRTYTICGTPEYLAPEIIQSRGHSTACDWWALGILIYEMLCGFPPFESESAYGIYKKVLAGNISWPKHVSEVAKDLLTKLLHPKPAYRLGNLKNAGADVRGHEWFKDLDWGALEGKKLRAPYLPKIRSENDTSNFPKYDERDTNPGGEVDNGVFPEFGGC